jgi:hypothetical protein
VDPARDAQRYVAPVVALVEELRRGFPRAEIRLQHDHPQVDLNIDIPREVGRPFDINLNVQGDELFLAIEGFDRSYNPCDDAEVLQCFRDVVGGLLSGSHRLVKHYRGRRVVGADLERLVGDRWETVVTGRRLPWFGEKRPEILRAAAGDGS